MEELEKRLKSMEDLMKHPPSNHRSGSDGAEFENDSRKQEASLFAIQSEAGTSDSSSSLDPALTIAGEDSQTSDFGFPSPEGK